MQREAAARAMALKPVEQDVTVTAATQDAVVLAPQRLAGARASSSSSGSSSAALRAARGCSRAAAAAGFAVCLPNARSPAAKLPACGLVRAASCAALNASSCSDRWWRRRPPGAPFVARAAPSGSESTEHTTAVSAAVAVHKGRLRLSGLSSRTGKTINCAATRQISTGAQMRA